MLELQFIKILYYRSFNRKLVKLGLENVWFLICIGKLGNNVLYINDEKHQSFQFNIKKFINNGTSYIAVSKLLSRKI